jgi:hypothetical protein
LVSAETVDAHGMRLSDHAHGAEVALLLDGYADPSLTTATRLLREVGGRLQVEVD